MNRISLIGRLTKDIEIRSTQSGKSVARFTLAVNRKYRKDSEQTVDFISCVAWEGTAETLEKYVKKGHRLAVEGKLETNEYENDGVKKKSYYVVVEQFEFLEPKQKDNINNEEQVPSPDEIPF